MPSQLRSLLASVLLSLLWACQDDATHGDDPYEGAADGGTIETELGDPSDDLGTMVEGVQVQPAKASFPLRVSDDGRRLVDSAGKPFLINQASSWGLIQSLSTEDARAYLDQLAARGWNTVMVSIISYDERMPGDPPAWRGIDPFEKRWDFSTPSDAYFEHADHILELARERGMLVTLVPCYLGFPTDDTQGWQDELLSSRNSVEKSRAYGRYLGERYKRFDNLIWIAGGDNQPAPGSELERRLKAIIDGIRETDPDHLWTGHWDGMEQGSMSTDNPTFAYDMDINGYYAFDYDLTYEVDLDTYRRVPNKPLFHLDMSYETEPGGEPEDIRRRAYTGMLSGAAGSSFNAGPDWYLWQNWRAVDSQGSRETTYWYRFFQSRPWHELVPDDEHEAVVDGFGTMGDVDYVCAAHTESWRLVVAYLPNGGAVSVDLGRLQGTRARTYWYDPTTGKAQTGGEFAADAVQRFSAPSRRSWVLIVEDAGQAWPEPGVTR